MSPIVGLLWVLAGVCAYAGAYYLFVGIRRPSRTFILFGVLCLAVMSMDATQIGIFAAESRGSWVWWVKLHRIAFMAAALSLMWFSSAVSEDDGRVTRLVLQGLTAAGVLATVLMSLDPTGLAYGEVGRLQPVSHPLIGSFATPDTTPGRLTWLIDVLILPLLIYPVLACVRLFRRGSTASALTLGGGMLAFLTANVVELVVFEDPARSIPADEIAFVILVFAMAMLMSTEIERARIAARDLRRSRERFRDLVDTAPEAILIGDIGANRWIQVNPAAAAVLEEEETSIVGAPLHRFLRRRVDQGPFNEAVRGALAGEPQVFEVGLSPEVSEASGASHEARMVRLPDEERDLVRLSLVDLGDRVRKEREENRLASRLQEVQKLEALSRLARGMSHGFNNLLAVIKGNLDLVLEQHPEGPVAERARRAHRGVRHGIAVTRGLASLSRTEFIDPEVVHLQDVAEDLERTLEQTLGPGISLDVDIPADLWPLRSEAAQLESALVNLAINARHALSGTGRVELQARNVVGPDGEPDEGPGGSPDGGKRSWDRVEVVMVDDGGGIPPEVVDRVFDPFFTTKGEGHGTGLGLSMVRDFARQCGGEATVESEPGRGTRIVLRFPRARTTSEQAPAKQLRGATASRTGQHVLVVEDDDQVRLVLSMLLRRRGFVVSEADGGAAGIDALRDDPSIDLLLTDVMLPNGIDGFEVGARVSALRPDLPIVYMTGYVDRRLIDLPDDLTPAELIRKPFDPDVLIRRIRAELDTAEIS